MPPGSSNIDHQLIAVDPITRPRSRPESRCRLLSTALLVVAGAALGGVAVTAGGPHEITDSPLSAEHLALKQCQVDVLKRLVSPASASLAEMDTQPSTLDTEGKDLFPLTLEEPLKGINVARIAVLNVSGVVNAPSEIGAAIQDHFECRAYFVDGSLVHTLVVFDHSH